MNSCLLCATPIRVRLSFLDVFLSRQTQQVICQSCFMQFEYISDRHCEVCYKPDISGVCQDCKRIKNPVMHRAIFHYNDFAKTYFKQYKFNGDFRLRAAFNQILRLNLKGQQIIPIPVSAERLQSRGFNQVTGFLSSANLPYLPILSKIETEHQSHKTRVARLSTDNPFRLNTSSKLPDSVLIFDDIYTTGTTLKHAIAIIKNAGCPRVSTFSLFR